MLRACFPLMLESHGRICAKLNAGNIHTAQRFSACASSLVEQGLAVVRVANGQRSRHVRREDTERHRRRFSRFWRAAFIIGDVAGNVVTASVHQQVVEAEALHFGDTPRRDPFAAHMVLVFSRFFQKQDGLSGPRHGGRHRGSANAAADDNQIVTHLFLPDVSLRTFTLATSVSADASMARRDAASVLECRLSISAQSP